MQFNNFTVKYNNLPPTLPVFPLSEVLLLPGMELPLNIFEPRYIRMIDDCMAERRILGMIQPRESIFSKVRKDKPLYDVGCAGKIKAFNETDDGRYMIVLSGLCRFRIDNEISTTRGYRRFKVDWKDFSSDYNFSDERENFSMELSKKALLEKVDKYLKSHGITSGLNTDINIDSIGDGFLIDFLCSYLPFSTEEKQLFLESPSLNERAKNLFNILGIAEIEAVFGSSKTIH
jgi:Lon protease-like protein